MAHIGDMLAEQLARYGVEFVFGQPGGQTAALYDGIARRAPRINHILFRDERNAGYAADAYARLTRRPGICDVTVGPGTTKLADGLLESYNASIPQVAIVGELPRDWEVLRERGVGSQGFDQVSFLKTMTKATWMVPSAHALPQLVRAAFRAATSGRPGPVALVIPHDVMDAEWGGAEEDVAVDPRYAQAPAFRPAADPEDIAAAARLLARAERPAIVAGGGVLGSAATAELALLAERVGALVVTSFSGKGAYPETAPRAGGVLNPLGSPAATELVKQADLILWVGCKVGQNTSLNWTLPQGGQMTIQIDIDAEELGRTFRPTAALCGDARAVLAQLAAAVTPRDRSPWGATIAQVKAQVAAARDAELRSAEVPIAPPRVMEAVGRRLGPLDVVISDASFSAGWIAQYLTARGAGRNFLFGRGLGGLGYAVPAALGAAAANPHGRVITISGDGGFSYALGELASQAQHGMPVVNIVINNGKLGWLQMWQHLYFNGLRQSVDLESAAVRPDFAAAAEAMGCAGFHIDRPEELDDALTVAFAQGRPAVIDVRVDPEATPIASFRRRLGEGKFYPRPGTQYELRPWLRSAEPASREAEPVASHAGDSGRANGAGSNGHHPEELAEVR